MLDPVQDARVRAAAFEWLADQVARQGDVLPRSVLADGFLLDGVRVPFVGPQGIFKPQILRGAPLSITTAPAGPYDVPSTLMDLSGTDIAAQIRNIQTTGVSVLQWSVVSL